MAALLPAQVPGTGSTGAINEDQFKQMHELRQDAAPVLLGSAVEVGGARCYLSLPKSPRPARPSVIVIHEWWGLNDHVKHWADRLALDGYSALAVDLYGGVVATTREDAMKAMKACDPAKSLLILQAAETFLRQDSRTQSKKVGSIGWCFGGGMSLRLGLASPTLDACALYYGQVPTGAEELKALRAPLYAVFGSKDPSLPISTVSQFVEGLTAAGKEHQVSLFLAEHAFANPSNPRYDGRSAQLAYEGLRTFLGERLKP